MDIFLAIIFIAFGLGLAIISKSFVNNGLHHMIHCFEVALDFLAIIFFTGNKCDWFVIWAISYTFWRNMFRLIGDCATIRKEYINNKEQIKENS